MLVMKILVYNIIDTRAGRYQDFSRQYIMQLFSTILLNMPMFVII